MNIRRCEHCNVMYNAQPSGRMATLCRACTQDCEDAYLKILKFLREKENCNITDLELVAEGSEVPVLFVKILYKEGRFSSKNEEKEIYCCNRCQAELKHDERDICGKCVQAIRRNLDGKNAYTSAESTIDDFREQTPVKSTPTDTGKARRYGLGR